MNLVETTQELRIVLAEAKTTTDCDITASYADYNVNNFTLGLNALHSNGTTPVVVVAAPAFETERQVKEIRLFNNDTVAHTVTLQLFDGTTVWVVAPGKVLVPPNGAFIYTPQSGQSDAISTLIVEDQNGDVIGQVGTLTFGGVLVSGTSPQAIVNMTTITGTAGVGTASGTVVEISGGPSGTGATGNGADLLLNGGTARSTNGDGGSVLITASNGTGTGDAGNVIMQAGTSPGGTPGSIVAESEVVLSFGVPTVPVINSNTITGSDQSGIISIGAGATTSVVVTFGGSHHFAPTAVVLSPANAAAATAGVDAFANILASTGWTLNGTALANCEFYYHVF